MKSEIVSLVICSLFIGGIIPRSWAKNPESWLKDLQLQKKKKYTQKGTSVAAVRGVEEISDVDLSARNFEAVEIMEKRSVAPSGLEQFKSEGKLKSISQTPPQTEPATALLEVLGQAPIPTPIQTAVRPISLEEELELGKSVAANVTAQFGLLQNEPLTLYINWVGLTVSQAAPRPEIPYRFAILDSPIVNAFAAPGGYIFVTWGLLTLLKDEAQLAGVLGHEIAHVTQKHVLKEIQKSRVVESAIPSYVKSSAKNAKYLNQITELAIQMLWKGLSREDELESDRLGAEFSAACGYSAQATLEVLEALKALSQSPKVGKELKFLLSTHPQPEVRIQSATENLKSLPAGGVRLTERFQKAVQ